MLTTFREVTTRLSLPTASPAAPLFTRSSAAAAAPLARAQSDPGALAAALLVLEALSKQRLGREAVASSGALRLTIEVMGLHQSSTALHLVRAPAALKAPVLA